MKRLWGRLQMAVKLTNFNASMSAFNKEGVLMSRWQKAFDEVAKARDHRKKYLWKKDYDLMGVMGRGMGPVVMCFCIALISFETHSWFTLVLPSFGLSPRLEFLVTLVSSIFPGRIFLDYFRTSFTDPGSPQSFSAQGSGSTSQGQADGDVELGALSSEVKTCHKCNGPKPPRCHHCKVCRRCVLRMDRHCPFVNNCVGLRNHRFFILFLLELVIACSILVVCLLPQLLHSLKAHPSQTLANRIHVITTFAVALIADSMLAPFFYFHMQLVIVNETTLENMKSRSQRGEIKMKLKQHEFALKRAEKAGDEEKQAEMKLLLVADTAKAEALKAAQAAEAARHQNGTFIENYIEVFGAPPQSMRRRVEAILEWFNPAPPTKKTRSAFDTKEI
jgi:palmitoyltransferase